MGFEVETVAKLVFPDGAYEGAEVFARCSLSIGEYLDFLAVRDAPADEVRPWIEALYGAFARYLVSWNLTKNGEPVPCTVEGLLSIDRELVRAIIRTWQDTAVDVTGPLGRPSSGGRPSAELSMPMEPLSESQAS